MNPGWRDFWNIYVDNDLREWVGCGDLSLAFEFVRQEHAKADGFRGILLMHEDWDRS